MYNIHRSFTFTETFIVKVCKDQQQTFTVLSEISSTQQFLFWLKYKNTLHFKHSTLVFRIHFSFLHLCCLVSNEGRCCPFVWAVFEGNISCPRCYWLHLHRVDPSDLVQISEIWSRDLIIIINFFLLWFGLFWKTILEFFFGLKPQIWSLEVFNFWCLLCGICHFLQL